MMKMKKFVINSIITLCIIIVIILVAVYFCVISNKNPSERSSSDENWFALNENAVSTTANGVSEPKPSCFEETSSATVNQSIPKGYSVWSPSCQMPKLDPFAPESMKHFKRQNYDNCSTSEPITRIDINWTTSEVKLIYNSTFMSYNCCYNDIQRNKTEDSYKLSNCTTFNGTITLPPTAEFIFVKCDSGGKTVYNNTHAIIRDHPNIRQRINARKAKTKDKRSLSVLMLAIDSISRLNLLRAMPKTAQHLLDNGWFDMQGYNKIDDNTFPNAMAMLTGYNLSLVYEKCNPTKIGELDKCPYIWRNFEANGYATAWGEESPQIGMFTYYKVGFVKPPTDYDLRPYFLTAKAYLQSRRKDGMSFCLGYKHSTDHLYDYAMDYAFHFKDDPSFGLFWADTFSHEDISTPSSMDFKITEYLKELDTRGILNNSMVILFSDHGLRFTPIRVSYTGWLEDRTPFLFIHLPEWFKNEHPEIVCALKKNRNRLTNPYDLHMTLKHLLQLSNPDQVKAPAASCPKCQSLFTEIPWNRSCEDAAILPHWCTCPPYFPHDKNDQIVQEAAKFSVDDINGKLKNFTKANKSPLCAHLKFRKVFDASQTEGRDKIGPYVDYLIHFDVTPNNATFESTVRFRNGSEMELTGQMSRLDKYWGQGDCIKIDYLCKYCYCV